MGKNDKPSSISNSEALQTEIHRKAIMISEVYQMLMHRQQFGVSQVAKDDDDDDDNYKYVQAGIVDALPNLEHVQLEYRR